MGRYLVFTASLFVCCCVFAQPYYVAVGAEFQAYPAGQMYGVRAAYRSGPTEYNLRLGYNSAFRKNFSGLNDNEQGGGPGFSPGYRHHFAGKILKNFFAGLRCDVWWLTIHWRDNTQTPPNGTTRITVVQPTAEAGYVLPLGSNWQVSLSLAFGREINAMTRGKAVGQGGISLVGITLTRKLIQ